MNIVGDTLEPSDLYQSDGSSGALYHPQNPTKTMECLNGNLDKQNLFADTKIEPWMCQIGTFARGMFWGSERWEYHHASQQSFSGLTSKNDKVNKISHPIASLCQTVFIPYDCLLLYGYQAWFNQEGTVWQAATDSNHLTEFWDVRVKVNGSYVYSQRVMLPPNRSTNENHNTGSLPADNRSAARHKYVAKSGMVSVSKGFFTFEVLIGSQARGTDQYNARCAIPSSSAWILALR
tara:strand:- start:2198 stop:2902 length:705 start_codon:yes stop_codon:yes gene_type:complete